MAAGKTNCSSRVAAAAADVREGSARETEVNSQQKKKAGASHADVSDKKDKI